MRSRTGGARGLSDLLRTARCGLRRAALVLPRAMLVLPRAVRLLPIVLSFLAADARAGVASAPPVRVADPVMIERRFVLRFRRAEEAAILIRPILSTNGSIVLQSKQNSLTVRDSNSVIERSAQAIATYDVPPRGASISVTLLKASTEPSPAAHPNVSDEIRGVGERLKKLFNFTGYTPLDSVVIQGTEGDIVDYVIGSQYRLEFLIDSTADETMVRLKNLTLVWLRPGPSGNETRREILKTSLNIPVGQTYVLGIGRDEAAPGALFMVFYAAWRTGGPGIKGFR
jgi:hypothetical protein